MSDDVHKESEKEVLLKSISTYKHIGRCGVPYIHSTILPTINIKDDV